MDLKRIPKDLQEPQTKHRKKGKRKKTKKAPKTDPHPDLKQPSTASDGDQQTSTFNTKLQATNKTSITSAGTSATTSLSGPGKVNTCILLWVKCGISNALCT